MRHPFTPWSALCIAGLVAACPTLQFVQPAAAHSARPADDRAALELPAELWAEMLGILAVDRIGYGREQMRSFGRDAHLLRTVEVLFEDVRAVPRYAGLVGDGLLEHAADPAETLRQAWLLTDVAAGRNLRAALGGSAERIGWGADWAVDEEGVHVGPIEVVRRAVGQMRGFFDATIMVEPDLDGLAEMPEQVQSLIARLTVAVTEGARWVRTAYDADAIRTAVARHQSGEVDRAAQHRFLTRPWSDRYAQQVATLVPASIRLLDDVDRDALAYASAIVATHVGLALEQFVPWAHSEAGRDALAQVAPEGTEFWTPLGMVRIAGPGPDLHWEPATILVDLGGDDRYAGAHAATDLDRPIAILIDVAGDDRYDGGDEAAALGCGMLGVALLIDLAGDDSYRVGASGIGRGLYGAGLVMDFAGDDSYHGDIWTQGAGHAGVGVLVDLSGDDRYSCAQQSQGLGGTLGAGVLIDVEGDDRYEARDDGNPSALYLGQSVAMSQGVGFGRRADLGDGRSLAGGVGVLVDGAGDDEYHAQVWAQGAGYWWGLGILEDRGGDDRYRNGKYSLGAAAHFAIGCAVDLSGDDQYNIGNDTAVNQYSGHARDGSIGVFIDGGGDDVHFVRNHCAGSGDLNSIGLFWSRGGTNEYRYEPNDFGPPNGWNETPPFGTTTRYESFRTFRDGMPAFGIFIDTGTARFVRGLGREVETIGPATGADGGVWWRWTAGASGMGIGRANAPDGENATRP